MSDAEIQEGLRSNVVVLRSGFIRESVAKKNQKCECDWPIHSDVPPEKWFGRLERQVLKPQAGDLTVPITAVSLLAQATRGVHDSWYILFYIST